ncbi:hypothetical protein, partial [Kitasatospora nipponensis]|uniref:hypothetical protein n=1 Tax=Kitasatospora nipponensis TaxID=258049 RepID=UPI0031D65CEE
MPGERCPACGIERTATGCACGHPDVTETAILPHLEGPPLVRPYVRTGSAVEDAFGTPLLPAPAAGAAHRPQRADV